MNIGLLAANVLAWPAIQLSTAWTATHLDRRYFAANRPLWRVPSWELDLYRRRLGVKRWKGALPDGATWVGGHFSKSSIKSHGRAYLLEFVIETRRAEAAHWVMLFFAPSFFLWDRPWASGVMAAYALAANLPCILAQRYNRGSIQRRLQPIASSK